MKALLIYCLLLTSCSINHDDFINTSKYTDSIYSSYNILNREYPDINLENSEITFALVEFVSGNYLKPFKKCLEPDVLCMDPPPLLLETNVILHLAGKKLEDSIQIATTSHYGLSHYVKEVAEKRYLLVVLFSDRENIILPRYSYKIMHIDANGVEHFDTEDKKLIVDCIDLSKKHEINYSKYQIDAKSSIKYDAKSEFLLNYIDNNLINVNVDNCYYSSMEADDTFTCLAELAKKNTFNPDEIEEIRFIEQEFLNDYETELNKYKTNHDDLVKVSGYILPKYGISLAEIEQQLINLEKNDKLNSCYSQNK